MGISHKIGDIDTNGTETKGVHCSLHPLKHDMHLFLSIPVCQRDIVGRHEAMALAGPHMVDDAERLQMMNSSLGLAVLENSFVVNNATSGMGYREWALRTLGVLTAMGDCLDQLDVYTKAALSHGATEAEVIAIINHAASFVGNPRAVNSIRRIKGQLQAAREYELPTLHMVRVGDHDTIVRDYQGPSGTPILLIHALFMDGYMFNKIMAQLAKVSRIITYDLRGHGVARGAPLVRSLEHLVEDLLLLLDTLGIPKVDIYGAAYGGAVAQYFTIAHQSRVRSLCLMAASSVAHPSLLSRATRAEQGQMKQLQTEAIIRWFTPETIADNTWCVRYARQKLERCLLEEWVSAWKAMSRLNCLHLIPQFELPILVLARAQDLSSTPERMRPIYEAAKSGTYIEINPGTHMMAMEQPDSVVKAF